MTNENKDILQTVTPALRDIVVRTANSYKRTLSNDVRMIDMGIFDQEAETLRQRSAQTGKGSTMLALVEHQSGKLLLTKPIAADESDTPVRFQMRVNAAALSQERRIRQDRSIGMLILNSNDQTKILSAVGELLVEEKDPLSPAGVMIVSEDGVNLFFRSIDAPEHARKENKEFVTSARGTTLKDFAVTNKLKQFYCPKNQRIATPAI